MAARTLLRMVPNATGTDYDIDVRQDTLQQVARITDLVNLIAIVGKGGSGKSALQNCLSNQPEAFNVGFGGEPVTEGADLLILSPQQRDLFGVRNGSLGLVDLEGVGATQDDDYHVKMLSPFMITSRVLIKNIQVSSSGRRLEYEYLNELYGLSLLAASFTRQVRGNNEFARLVIVFRDVSGDKHERDEFEVSMKRALFDPVPPNPITPNFRRSMPIREALLSLFGGFDNITVLAFPEPPGARGVKNLNDPPFQAEVVRLRQLLGRIVNINRNFNGVPLTGPVLAEVMERSVANLNENRRVFEGNMMNLIEAALLQQAHNAALDQLTGLLEANRALGLIDPVRMGIMGREMTDAVMTPFIDSTRFYVSNNAQTSKLATRRTLTGLVTARINENNDRVRGHIQDARNLVQTDMSVWANNLHARILADYSKVKPDIIRTSMNQLQQDVHTRFIAQLQRSRIPREWAIVEENVISITNDLHTRRDHLLRDLVEQERAVLRVRDQASTVNSNSDWLTWITNHMPDIRFTRSNQERLRDVHADHFQNIAIKNITIVDMLRAAPMPHGIEGSLNNFRRAVQDIGRLDPHPNFANFGVDLTRTQLAIQQGATYLTISSGPKYCDIPLGQLLAMCWNLVRGHKERQHAAIRMMQEISEGVDQHPDPTHANPSPNCGSGRSPRLINALRGFVDVGFQTVDTINSQAFQIEFANRVTRPENIPIHERLELANQVCMEYGVVGVRRDEWIRSVEELL